MSGPCAVVAKPLLQEDVPHNTRCAGNTFVLIAFALGFGSAVLLSKALLPMTTLQGTAVDMAWQPVQARPSQMLQSAGALPYMQSPKISAVTRNVWENGLATGLHKDVMTKPSAIPSSRDLRKSTALADFADIRDTIRSSPAQKCVYVDKYASLCGDLVVLRPSTAIRATTDKKSQTGDADNLIEEIKSKIDSIENKPQAALYAGGAVVGLVVANGILTSVKSLPLVSDAFELIGTGYTAWFVYRYLLFEGSRKELMEDIEQLKNNLLR